MTLSRRYALILIVLFLVTGVFVVRSAGVGKQLDSCRDPEALKWLDLVPGTQRTLEVTPRYTPRRTQWSAGVAGTKSYNDPQVKIRMVRDFSIFQLWLYPRLAVKERSIPDVERLEWIDTGAGRLPVHLEYYLSGSRPRLIIYAYMYDLEPVVNPFAAAFRGSFRAVVEGSRPLTMLLVSGSIEHGRLPVLEASSSRWLVAAYERFRKVCGA